MFRVPEPGAVPAHGRSNRWVVSCSFHDRCASPPKRCQVGGSETPPHPRHTEAQATTPGSPRGCPVGPLHALSLRLPRWVDPCATDAHV